jgi:hypothetical protein
MYKPTKTRPTTKSEARRWFAAKDMHRDPPECEYGHDGCSVRPGGPCGNELEHEFDLFEEHS